MAEAFAAMFLEGDLSDPRARLARATEIGARYGCEIQFVRPEAVAGPRHVASAVQHALRAHEQSRERARTLSIELLCFVTGERQIAHALEAGGLSLGARQAVGIAIGRAPRKALEEVASALGLRTSSLPEAKRDFEAKSLERVALLDLER